MNDVFIYGPKDNISNIKIINVTSHSIELWSKLLSPFYIGPIKLYRNFISKTLESGWQYSKVYKEHLDSNGDPSTQYWQWAKQGWNNSKAVRYPKGKGVKPAYLYWDGEKLDYVSARLKVYFIIYRDAVRQTDSFGKLQELFKKEDIHLWDFDGYKSPLGSALTNPNRPMGHAFVLKAMLLYGPNVTPEQVAIETQKQKDAVNKHFLDFDY